MLNSLAEKNSPRYFVPRSTKIAFAEPPESGHYQSQFVHLRKTDLETPKFVFSAPDLGLNGSHEFQGERRSWPVEQ
jgi:hypothetical protein